MMTAQRTSNMHVSKEIKPGEQQILKVNKNNEHSNHEKKRREISERKRIEMSERKRREKRNEWKKPRMAVREEALLISNF